MARDKTDGQMAGTKYLKLRGGLWQYRRRVPKRFRLHDPRELIEVSLHTPDIEIAKLRRDAQVEEDDAYWARLVAGEPQERAWSAYQLASTRARAFGVVYRSAAEIAADGKLEDILARVELLKRMPGGASNPANTAAVLGAASRPGLSLSSALEDVFFAKIMAARWAEKSADQLRKIRSPFRLAVRTFEEQCGPQGAFEITRQHAQDWHEWMNFRILEGDIRPGTAGKYLGKLRKFWREYAAWENPASQPSDNPFAGLSFGPDQGRPRPPFEPAWIQSHFLQGDGLARMDRQARHIFLIMIETGARLSEVAAQRRETLLPFDNLPVMKIEPSEARTLKTGNSQRDLPLVGVALEAARAAVATAEKENRQMIFDQWADRTSPLSDHLNHQLRERGLTPTPKHTVYSLRHGWYDRAIAIGMDTEIRRAAMGHSSTQPRYGAGARLDQRTELFEKMALAFDRAVVG